MRALGSKDRGRRVALARDLEGAGSQGEGREKIQKDKLRHEMAGLGQVWKGPGEAWGSLRRLSRT